MTAMLEGFYQMGFVARDLDRAMAAMCERYGVRHFRRKRSSDTMESAHAWIGDTMIEILAVSKGGPDIYDDHIPDDPDAVRLHHHGYRVRDAAAWEDINRQVDARGLATSLRGSVMDGQLNYLYADTRAELGLYTEYVFLIGDATKIYDDVPHN